MTQHNWLTATLRRAIPNSELLLPVMQGPLRLVPIVVGLGLASAALEGLGIGLIIPLLHLFTGKELDRPLTGLAGQLFGFANGFDANTRIAVIASTIVALIALKNLVAFAGAVSSAWIYGGVSHGIRMALANRLLTVAFPFFLKESHGRILNILSNEAWRAADALQVSLRIVVSICAGMVLTIFLLLLSWQMTLAVMLGLATIHAVQIAISRSFEKRSVLLTLSNGRLASLMLHIVSSARAIRLFGQEGKEQGAFDSQSNEVRRQVFALEFRKGGLPPLMEVLQASLFMAVLIGALAAQTDFAVVATFIILLYRVQPHVRNVQDGLVQLKTWNGPLRDVAWLLDQSPDAQRVSSSRQFQTLREAIHFENVSFQFSDGGKFIVDGITFDIKARKATALIGRSGAGKTTIVNMICRLLEPSKGLIKIDGIPLDEFSISSWRQQIAVASQDLEIFEGTISDNIAYGAGDVSRERIMEAARMADAHDFILALPGTYDAHVGHRGTTLSAGQRQRLGLARALIRSPQILILDEATNAVDGISESAIIATLQARAGKQTTIVISHQGGPTSICDEVVEITRDGKLRRSGATGFTEQFRSKAE